MPKLSKIPKDTIFLIANDMADYERIKQRWETWGWVLSADFHDDTYEVIAMKDSKILVLLFEPPSIREKREADNLEDYGAQSDQVISGDVSQETSQPPES